MSATTVSHTLSGRRPVSSSTRHRVLKAVEDLGYRPNRLAGSLRTQRTHTMALVVPDITNPFYPEVALGLQKIIAPHGYQLFICSTDGAETAEQSFIADVVDRRADGVVFAPTRDGAAGIEAAVTAGVPIVVLSAAAHAADKARWPGADVVRSDDERGMAMATRYLLEKGHTRLGFINGAIGVGPSERRLAGHLAALRDAGVEYDPDLVVSTEFTRSGGVQGATQLLDLPAPPTGILCGNDLIAIGVLDVAGERRKEVPRELAVIGFDDIEAAALVSPPLTTVINPARELGQVCGRLLLDRLTGEYTSTGREAIVGNELVLRGSS